MNDAPSQGALFALPPREIPPAEARPELVAIAARLPASIRFGTTSWSYPGWAGTVYGAKASPTDLANHGLTAYAKHPLLRAVEIGRTFYEPVPASTLRALAAQVPDDFRFVAKAHEDCVTDRFPLHARYGKKRGEVNPLFLDAAFAADAVVAPFVEGLGAKGGALLFQFPPRAVDQPQAFASALHAFLSRLPKGVGYAVEVRNEELLTADYAYALEDAGAVHCHNVWASMPPLAAQAKRIAPAARRPLVIRWMLQKGDTFEAAGARYAPFAERVDPDETNRARIADLVTRAHAHGVEAWVLVDNKAEGCAPKSIAKLAEAIAARGG